MTSSWRTWDSRLRTSSKPRVHCFKLKSTLRSKPTSKFHNAVFLDHINPSSIRSKSSLTGRLTPTGSDRFERTSSVHTTVSTTRCQPSRCVTEFEDQHNTRLMDTEDQTAMMACGSVEKRLRYVDLIGPKSQRQSKFI